MDITQLILDDHHEQRRLFAILEQIDRADTGTLSAVWARLSAFLELHAAAEEEIFYPALLRTASALARGQRRGGDARRDPRPQRHQGCHHRGRGPGGRNRRVVRRGRRRERGERRSHGRGGARRPDRLPPPRWPDTAPRPGRGLRSLRGQAFRRRSRRGQGPGPLRAGGKNRGSSRRPARHPAQQPPQTDRSASAASKEADLAPR